MSAPLKLIPFPGPRPPAESGEHDDRRASLEGALAKVRQRWGYSSIVRLDGGAAPPAGKPTRRPKSTQELPPWWPRPLGSLGQDGAAGMAGILRPRLLEVVAEPGSGRLTLSLAWLAAARPTIAAIVDLTSLDRSGTIPPNTPAPPAPPDQPSEPGQSSQLHQPNQPNQPNQFAQLGHAGLPEDSARESGQRGSHRRIGEGPRSQVERFYPPTATTAGLDLTRMIVVHPPAGNPRAPLDAVVVLLRSEAFDVVVCPLPPRARISTSFAAKLATLAARANTSLLLLTSPTYTADGYASGQAGALAAFADYRVRLTTRRWIWADGELAGLKLRAVTERARASSQDALYTASPPFALSSFAPSTPEGTLTAVEHDLTFRLHRRLRSRTGADLLSLTTSRRRVQPATDLAPADVESPIALPTAPPLRLLANA
jgi:hypothetical protein